MSIKAWPDKKDPQDVVDYDLDWGAERLEVGETLVNAVWAIVKIPAADVDNPLTINSSVFQSSGLTKVWLSGGVKGQYTLTCHVTTSSVPARQYDWSKYLKVEHL
jgi:hypothetical protein